jgi:uncharacterized membrane protein YbaN (DUF454 family)
LHVPLVRGLTHSFLICFIVGAILHAMPTAGFALMQQAPGGISENMGWLPALSAVGFFGSLVSAAGFVLLAIHLLAREAQPAQPRCVDPVQP